ncbi:MAG: DNA repair protein RadA [Gammaproteobacteria bacterium]|nr:DNA repair protein RadA [Gammaproteobacteria bacterium]MDH5729323.1 DNA repair protein RadA [Gammaproteobacteria bacterium]
MAKTKVSFVCTQCGSESPKWIGQCPDCQSWNSFEEVQSAPATSGGRARFAGYAGNVGKAERVLTLAQVEATQESRITAGSEEFDRVLGGGLVFGSVVLLGGDPGIGKSTILLQTMVSLSLAHKVLYITGEESLQQVSMRAQRLNLQADRLRLLAETQIENILATAHQEKPRIMVIDSIQSVYTEAVNSAPGAVSQLRESTAQLVQFAKQTNTALFLVGHVTKEGVIAGPRVLEHMVDTVLYFEGERDSRYRMLRAVKNRFGAVNELGVFAMTDSGLKAVSNPSAIFLSRHEEPVSGSVITVTREGTRPLLVELQSLVDESYAGHPKRVTLGLEQNRLSMLLAVLHRHAQVAMYDQDVYVNVVGGVRVAETAVDLAVLMAALSSFRNKPIDNHWVVFGEVGLAGEIRPVPSGEERVKEAVKHGFTKIILPKANQPRNLPKNIEIIAVSRLSEAVSLL